LNRTNPKQQKRSDRPRRQNKRQSQVKRSGLTFNREILVLPPERHFRQVTGFIGVIPASTLPAGVTGYFTVFGNTVFQPFESIPKADSATGYITETNGGDTNTLSGYTQIVSQYAYGRTMRSRIRVSCLPSATGDQVMLVVFAASAADVTSLSLPCSYTYARAQIGFREAVCTSNSFAAKNVVECEISSTRPLGLTKTQYLDQPPNAVTSAPPASTLDWRWVVQYFLMDGATNANTIPFKVEVAYDNLYSGPIPSTH